MMRYVHTNIISKDWKKLADFYIKTFNCTLIPPVRKQSGPWLDEGLGMSNVQLQGAHLRLPGYGDKGPTLEIYQYSTMETTPPSHPNSSGYAHIAFEVENVAETFKTVLKNGGNGQGKISETVVEGIGKITFVYVRDPDGNLIELQSWK